jgi:hypothetical protein
MMILLSCESTKLPYTNVSDDPAPDQDARRLFVGDVTLHGHHSLQRDCTYLSWFAEIQTTKMDQYLCRRRTR